MDKEILTVHKVMLAGYGIYDIKCPHCQAIISIEAPVRGEQFTHNANLCGGVIEVFHDAQDVDSVKKL